MDLGTVLAYKNSPMATITQESTLMAPLKDMVSTIGRMAVFIGEISVMEQDTGMEYGRIRVRPILGLIGWTIRRGLESTHGKTERFTRDSLEMIIDRVMGRCIASID